MAKKNRFQQESIQPAVAQAAGEEAVEFDTWYGLREHRIPKHHHKEVLMADFRARGLSMREPASKFDEALKMYGVSLD